MPVPVSAFSTIADEVSNEAEVANSTATGCTNRNHKVAHVLAAASECTDAATELSPAPAASLALRELFLQLFASAALLVFIFLSLLAFVVGSGLFGRNSFIGERLFVKSFG